VGAGQGQVTLLSEEGQLLEELTEEEADIARKRVLETLGSCTRMGTFRLISDLFKLGMNLTRKMPLMTSRWRKGSS